MTQSDSNEKNLNQSSDPPLDEWISDLSDQEESSESLLAELEKSLDTDFRNLEPEESEASIADFVIYDEAEPCPYLPNRMARMPLRYLTPQKNSLDLDQRLSEGERRSGRFVYKTNCEDCNACEAIRIPVADFKPSRSQKRALKKGLGVIETRFISPIVDQQRVDLFNKHRNVRGLCHDGLTIDEGGYRSFLVDTCFDTFEMSYHVDGKLIGTAICDQGENTLSAVYCFYDPEYSHLSIGTFSIMQQIEYCKSKEFEFLYLGFYVEDSEHVLYKQRFLPHERLIDECWIRTDRQMG